MCPPQARRTELGDPLATDAAQRNDGRSRISQLCRRMSQRSTRRLARQVVDSARGVRRRDAMPYATHLPVLIALARVRRIETVLEFGAGRFSTGLFLNRAAFPDVVEVTTYEDNAEWADRVVNEAAGDARLTVLTVPSVPTCVPETIAGFDLVFIDDSLSATARSGTVRSVADRRPLRSLVAIHDFELRELATAARSFDHVYRFRTFTPQVGIAWFGEAVTRRSLTKAQSSIARHRTTLPVADAARWAAAL
jgi:hypothetical protein